MLHSSTTKLESASNSRHYERVNCNDCAIRSIFSAESVMRFDKYYIRVLKTYCFGIRQHFEGINYGLEVDFFRMLLASVALRMLPIALRCRRSVKTSVPDDSLSSVAQPRS